MEQWEIDFRKKAEETVTDGRYNTPLGRLNKKDYIEHQVNKERIHRKLLEDERNGIKDFRNQ